MCSFATIFRKLGPHAQAKEMQSIQNKLPPEFRNEDLIVELEYCFNIEYQLDKSSPLNFAKIFWLVGETFEPDLVRLGESFFPRHLAR